MRHALLIPAAALSGFFHCQGCGPIGDLQQDLAPAPVNAKILPLPAGVLETTRRLAADAGFDLPMDHRCPPGTALTWSDFSPSFALVGCNTPDAGEPLGQMLSWTLDKAGTPYLEQAWTFDARGQRTQERSWWPNGQMKSDLGRRWIVDGGPESELACDADAGHCIWTDWWPNGSLHEKYVRDQGDRVETLFPIADDPKDVLRRRAEFYRDAQTFKSLALGQRLSRGDDLAFDEVFTALDDDARAAEAAAALALINTPQGFLQLIHRVGSYQEKQELARFVRDRLPIPKPGADLRFLHDPRVLTSGVGRAALRALAQREGKEPWEAFLEVVRVSTPDDLDTLVSIATSTPWLGHYLARRAIPDGAEGAPDTFRSFLAHFESTWMPPDAQGWCRREDREALALSRLMAPRDTDGLIRVLYSQGPTFWSIRSRWSAARALADSGVMEGKLVYAGKYDDLPDDGVFQLSTLEAYLPTATGAERTKALALLPASRARAEARARAREEEERRNGIGR